MVYRSPGRISCVDAVFERLDRAVTNHQSINLYKETRVKKLSIVGSDHSPIFLTMDS